MTASAGLTKEDYIKILEFYNVKIPTNYSKIKNMATDILSNQLCKCVSTNKSYKCLRNKTFRNRKNNNNNNNNKEMLAI
jgi:hypothetical protein